MFSLLTSLIVVGENYHFEFVYINHHQWKIIIRKQVNFVYDFILQEVSGRIIRVEFAKKFKKPRPQRSASAPARETQHKLYVSNLSWKVRSTHLREFFSANFNPVSSKVVFESNEGRSAGYGFVSFATKEEAEAAISSLDGKVTENKLSAQSH